MALIKGILKNASGVRPNTKIILIAQKTTFSVIQHAPDLTIITDANGAYSFECNPSKYLVVIMQTGNAREQVGTIEVYSDSVSGSINDFLTQLKPEELTPELIHKVESLRNEAQEAADESKSYSDLSAELLAKSVISADKAQSAADAAAASGKIYSTIAQGIAATTNGDLFLVVSDKASGFSDLYLNDNGTGVYQGKTTIDISFVQKIAVESSDCAVNLTQSNIMPVITNTHGDVLLGYDDEKQIVIAAGINYDLNPADDRITPLEILADDTKKHIFDDASSTISDVVMPIVTDTRGNVLLGYDDVKQQVVAAGINTGTEQQMLQNAKHIHLLGYGQSLSNGTKGKEAISLTQPFSNVTFNGGVRCGGESAESDTFLPLKPLVESTAATGDDRGETHCSSTANYLSLINKQELGIEPNSQVFLASTSGRGRMSINQCLPSPDPTMPFNKELRSGIENAYLADNDYVLSCVFWMQGEADILMPANEYKNKLLQLQRDVTELYRQITGKSNNVYFVTYQLSRNSIFNDVAGGSPVQAMLDVTDNEYFSMSTPTYRLPFYTDHLHLINVGYKLLGCYCAMAAQRIIYGKNGIDTSIPIKPKYAKKLTQNSVKIEFDVIHKPLVLNQEKLFKTKDYGFAVINGDALLTVESVSIVDDTNVVITTSEAINDDAKIRYARDYKGVALDGHLSVSNCGTGDLMDSCTKTVKIENEVHELYNVCPHFILNVISEEI